MSTNLDFHNKIAKLCIERFESLPKTGKPKENEWTVLSCIVLEDSEKLEVIALSTGTKCIGHDKMSKDGDILNDSHAEVICRRAFLRFIYDSILSQHDTFLYDPEKQIFTVKPNVKFHFFSTQVPCGDATIFAKQNLEDFGDLIEVSAATCDCVETKRIKLTNDIFRTGAKCLNTDEKQDLKLQGFDYHVTGVVRTKPGRGTPTLSVSCSDKLAKWCHLGLQGALLSLLLKKPIYLSSFTIAGSTPFNDEAMKRALFDRLGNPVLQEPYHRNDVTLGQATLKFLYEKSDNKNPCPSSIIWYKGSTQCEVAIDGRRQGVTKKQLKTVGALRICKLKLYESFVKILNQFKIKLKNIDSTVLTYQEAKLCANDYYKTWIILKKSFKVWTTKDENLLQFRVKL
ncbi:tRNA-specific adenosine deaminase 1 [Tribolium madens]|uniref:tRNA-specific adenosine deaminase 1 n=1 Tax=Tribolium madens TaxID=41895 RepID=UPI001CF73D22|nr:tRNA-specific adenosine deaminase 1 [Tribolium madens]